MLKTLAIALAFLLPTAALAAPSPYVEATSAYNGHDADYGAKVGLQTGNVTLEAGAENFFETPTYIASVGLQPKIFGPFSAYANVGYLNTSGNSGFRLAGGGVVNLTNHIYAKGGYQRDDYGNGHSDRGTVGLGVRF